MNIKVYEIPYGNSCPSRRTSAMLHPDVFLGSFHRRLDITIQCTNV